MYNNHEKVNRGTNYGYPNHLALAMLDEKKKEGRLYGVGDFENKTVRVKTNDTSGGHQLFCPKKY
jgi:hypothetical protein